MKSLLRLEYSGGVPKEVIKKLESKLSNFFDEVESIDLLFIHATDFTSNYRDTSTTIQKVEDIVRSLNLTDHGRVSLTGGSRGHFQITLSIY